VLAIRDDIRRAQAGAQADNIARLAQLFGERSKQGRLLEPENDSARYYYNALHQAAPDHPSTLAARTAFGAQLLDAAHTAVSRDDLPAAERLLAAAQQADAAANELESLRHELALARETAARAAAVVPAGVLKRLRYVAPVYPIAAREKDLAGWVDLEFTVRADGSVGDVRAVRADPPGVFEAAATTAIAAWRFQPVQHDGRTIEQRAALRVRFALNQ
jgi:protein TonB